MQESLHQLGLSGLVRVVTSHTVGLGERLTTMRLDESSIRSVMAVETQRRSSLRQVIGKFRIRFVTRLVRGVTGVATEIESGVPAAVLRNVKARVVAAQAEVLGRIRAGRPLQEIIGLACGMWVVAREAVSGRLVVHVTAGLRVVFIVVTLQTELGGCGGEQFDARHVFGHAHLMTTQTAFFGSGMSVLVLGLLLVAAQARSRVSIGIQLGWVLLCGCNDAAHQRDERCKKQSHDCSKEGASRV